MDEWWPALLAFLGFVGCMAVVWLIVAGVVHLECRRHARRRATQMQPATARRGWQTRQEHVR
ncbi:MAG: hypothetical protein REI94_01255 [Moraxellaceae bacterium]|nr:hypothetical protein [Moraxellaceae bacterium]